MLKSILILVLSSFIYVSLGEDNTSAPEEAQSSLLADLLEGVEEEEVLDSFLFETVISEHIGNIRYALERFPEQLVEYKHPQTGYSPFLMACYIENIEIMELILDTNPEVINDVDNNGKTCVNLLISEGVYDGLNQKIKNLIDRGADVTKADYAGDTPWLSACVEGNVEIMDYLRSERGVDINSANTQDDWTCLHYLAAKQHTDDFRTLVDQGADFTKTTDNGDTPWLISCGVGDTETMDYLRNEKGVDVNSVNTVNGATCLHYLAAGQHTDDFRKLADQEGVDITKTMTDTGDNPWFVACGVGGMEIMDYLLDEKEVDVNSVNAVNGAVCLHYLAMGQHEDYIRNLMSRGADHKIKDGSDRLPAHILIQAQNPSPLGLDADTMEQLQALQQMLEE